MVPLVAIFALLLMATMALAVDLSVTTAFKRNLQNVTDAAALAGARQLPATVTLANEEAATQTALQLVHNSLQWPSGGGSWWNPLLSAGCPNGGSQCSVTVCVGMTTGTPCTSSVAAGTSGPFVLTVNAPPRTAKVASYNGDPHRIEVLMYQKSGAFFAGFMGQSQNEDGAQSVAFHFAPGQPFPFALYSRTIIQSGNDGETVSGNIYADRYLQPQDHGHAGICAGPDSNGNPGFIFLGSPQQDDGSPPYQNDGQSSTKPLADPILQGVTCPTAGNVVGMSATPATSGCAVGYPGNQSGAALTFDSQDGACESNPPIQPPTVAAPVPPAYPSTVCGAAVLSGGEYQPNEYTCPSGAALTVDHPLAQGIYEIDAGARTGGCDVVMDGTITSLPGVTFYLKGGAGICITVASGVTISQTPFNANTGKPGDGRYIVLSDNVANPSITLSSGGGGSASGIWSLSGVIWLPTGSVTISNKTALEDSGQIIVNSWNDQSGYHQNPSVSFNPSFAPQQREVLQLSE
ncbi:MAG: Tad domain-containing protein [Candidatus Dormibacteria bacterium]